MKIAALTGVFTFCSMAVAFAAERPAAGKDAVTIAPASLPATGQVSDRYLSYNIEMVEVTGGRFWKPYGTGPVDRSDMYEYRPPLDLTNSRLRKLARALGPAYVRYSGTWANATWFSDTENFPGKAPVGYDTVLTRKQWRKAVQLAEFANARIVVSVPTSTGTRDKAGIWQARDTQRWFDYTRRIGGQIAASEFANEPNFIGATKPPEGYTAADYRRDYGIFHDWLRKASPSTLILAPGALELGYDGLKKLPPSFRMLPREELVVRGAALPDIVSFHYYGGTSQRCIGTSEADARAAHWLSAIDPAIDQTRTLGRNIAPNAPIWLTETAETACGGNPWAKTFTDTFRFAEQLARSARQGVQVYMHNTLAASDYALLDENSFAPRPNYWVAYLWRQFMGTTVLDAGAAGPGTGLRSFAHCQRGVPGGVTLLVLNTDRGSARELNIGGEGRLYSLTQPAARPAQVALNGRTLALGAKDALPAITGKSVAGTVRIAPDSVNFLTVPAARNPACSRSN